MDWSVKTAKEIVGKWGYEEKEWWQPIAESLTQSRQDLLKELRGEVGRMRGEWLTRFDKQYFSGYNRCVDDIIKLLEKYD
jgi:hypothetical protein